MLMFSFQDKYNYHKNLYRSVVDINNFVLSHKKEKHIYGGYNKINQDLEKLRLNSHKKNHKQKTVENYKYQISNTHHAQKIILLY